MTHDLMLCTGTKNVRVTDESLRQFLLGTDRADVDYHALYSGVPLLYRAVQVIGNTVSSLPLGLYAGESDDNSIDDPTYAWVTRGLRERIKRTAMALMVYGQAYWVVSPTPGARDALECRWVPSVNIVPQYTTARGLVGFERKLDAVTSEWYLLTRDPRTKQEVYRLAGNRRIAPELLHFWEGAIDRELYPGISPVQAAARAAGVEKAVSDFIQQHFERGLIKAFLFVVERGGGNPSEQEVESFIAKFQQTVMGGLRGAFRPMLASLGLTPHIVGEGIEGLHSKELSDKQIEDMLGALGVPKSIIIAGSANYATAHQEAMVYLEHTIRPIAMILVETLNDRLLHRAGLTLTVEMDRLEAYQKAEAEKAQGLVALVGAGILTPDEARETMDYAPYATEDGPALPPIGEVFGTGAISHNEIRAMYGLDPMDTAEADRRRELTDVFALLAAGTGAGLEVPQAAALIGLELPAPPPEPPPPLAASPDYQRILAVRKRLTYGTK